MTLDKNYWRKQGVYGIYNTVNNKMYVGSSKNIASRISSHKHLLKYNKHSNKYLQNAFNKYGENNFKAIVLRVCKIQNLLRVEDFYITKYNTLNSKFGYNLTLASIGTKNYKWSKKDRENLSKSKKGSLYHPNTLKGLRKYLLNNKNRPRSKKQIEHSKIVVRKAIDSCKIKVNQFNIFGVFINTYNSLKEASLKTNTCPSKISLCVNYKRDTANNYVWRKVGESFSYKGKYPILYSLFNLKKELIIETIDINDLIQNFGFNKNTLWSCKKDILINTHKNYFLLKRRTTIKDKEKLKLYYK